VPDFAREVDGAPDSSLFDRTHKTQTNTQTQL